MLVSKLLDTLSKELSNAEELWVAVGLLNSSGLNNILSHVRTEAKLNFLIGIDLPTEPKAMQILHTLSAKREISVHIIVKKGTFFHPKVYISRSHSGYTAFVGSANCTVGGLANNMEMSLETHDSGTCQSLKQWFEETQELGISLTSDFIKKYIPKYKKRIARTLKDKAEVAELKQSVERDREPQLIFRKQLEKRLLAYCSSAEYAKIVKRRKEVVKNLKQCLDHPNFEEIDLKRFLAEKELGTIHERFVEKHVRANKKKFRALLSFICDESIPIQQRMNEALCGKLAIPQIKKAFLSKVLVVHRPDLYYLHNGVSDLCLKHFGLTFPRGLSAGRQYQLAKETLKKVRDKVGINDFATLDAYLWKIKHDLQLK